MCNQSKILSIFISFKKCRLPKRLKCTIVIVDIPAWLRNILYEYITKYLEQVKSFLDLIAT